MLDKFNPKVLVVIAVIFASFSSVFNKLSNMPAMILVAYRLGFAVLILLPAVLKNSIPELKKVDKKSMTLCVFSGIFLALHFIAWTASINYTSVASAVVLVNVNPIFIVIGSYFIFKQRVSKKAVMGIFVAFIGCVIVSVGDSTLGTNIIYGDILALTGALFAAGYFLIGQFVRQRLSVSAYTFLVYTSSFITLVILSFITKTPLYPYPIRELIIALSLAVFCTMFGHSIFNWSLQYVSATFVSTTSLGAPVAATLWAFLIFKEIPTPWQIGGSLIIVSGIYFFSRFSNKEEKKKVSRNNDGAVE